MMLDIQMTGIICFFFFKQKTAYEMRISDWSSDVCSSDLGSGGGVRLARPAAAISVADIIEAVEGPIALTACVAEGRHDCSLEGSCKVQPPWGGVNGAARRSLPEVSLASLVKRLPLRGGGWEGPVSAHPAASCLLSNPSRKAEGEIAEKTNKQTCHNNK